MDTDIIFGEILGEIFNENGKYPANIVQGLSKKDISFTTTHLQKHVIAWLLWKDMLEKIGVIDLNYNSAQTEAVKDEDEAVVASHAHLANSLCSCGSNSLKAFKSAAIWRNGKRSYRMLTTYMCPDCKSELRMNMNFATPAKSWFRRLFGK